MDLLSCLPHSVLCRGCAWCDTVSFAFFQGCTRSAFSSWSAAVTQRELSLAVPGSLCVPCVSPVY